MMMNAHAVNCAWTAEFIARSFVCVFFGRARVWGSICLHKKGFSAVFRVICDMGDARYAVIGVSRPPVLDCGTIFHPDYGGRDSPSTPSDNP